MKLKVRLKIKQRSDGLYECWVHHAFPRNIYLVDSGLGIEPTREVSILRGIRNFIDCYKRRLMRKRKAQIEYREIEIG